MNFFYPSKSRLGKKEFLLCHGQKHILPVLDQHAKFDLNIKLELKFFFFFFSVQFNSTLEQLSLTQIPILIHDAIFT